MSVEQVVTVIVTAVVTGGFSTFTTVASLKTHINYLRESLTRAHERIDRIEQRL